MFFGTAFISGLSLIM
ncbi:Protein of unknown function [Bacillus mycoides]|nr:Protein of unknown function [Bacillus mycoides]